MPARCVALRVRCPGQLGSCSPVCPLGALLCVCGVLGHLAPVHRWACSACGVACAVSWATWLLITGVPAVCAVWCVRCPGPPGPCLPVCPLGALLCVCGVLGHLAPVHRCARLVRCFACAVSWATWLLFTGVPARCVACVCGVLGHVAPVHRRARLVRCFACAVSWATWLLFTGVPARRVVLRVRCPWPVGSCSPLCPLGVLCCVCSVVGHSAPVPVCPLCVLCGVCRVLGHLAPVHQCAGSVRCFACAVSWATWLLFTDVPARCVVLLVRCPGPLGSCSPVCLLGPLICVCGVVGHVAPVHRCAPSVCCFSCAVSWVTWLLFTGVPARCVVCVCSVLGHLAPVHRCARSVCCVACAVSWATWLLFTGVSARCVVLRLRCPGPLGSCSPVHSPGVLCGVLGHLAPVHRCARSVCCAVGCVCGALLRGAHSPIWTVAIRSRQGLGTLRARTRPSGRRLFVAGRGWVPSGRKRVNPHGGCSVAGRGWVRCRARTRPSRRQLVLLGTCPRAVARCLLYALSGIVAPGSRRCLAPVRVSWLCPAACLSGVPPGPAWCAAPRPVRSLSVLRSSFPTLWFLSPSQGLAPPALLGGCAGHAEAGREPGSLCLLPAPAEARALGSLRVVPVRGPAMGLSLAGPSGVGVGLRALRWLACVGPVTDASGFPYRPSFDRGNRPVHRGCFVWTPTPPLAGQRTPRPGPMRVCVCLLFLAGSGGRASPARFGAPHLFFWPFCLSALLGPLWAGVAPVLVLSLPSPPPFAFFFRFSVVVSLAPPLLLAFFGFRPRVPWALALCVVCFVGLALLRSPPGLASLVLPGR